MKRLFLFILILILILSLVLGCTYTPENTLSADQKEELKNKLLTGQILYMTYKEEYSNKFDNQDLAKHIYDGVYWGADWYKLIKENIYEYEDGTVRINFGSDLAFEPETTVENFEIVEKRELGVKYLDDAMKKFRSDYRFDDREGLNNFEVYLIDLLERISINIWSIGYYSDRRIDLENIIAESNAIDGSLGIETEALNENQKTEYSICQYIDSDIQRFEDDFIELASYFDITWVES